MEAKLGKRYAAERVRPFARKLLTAVAAMHASKVAHCDLKPENLVLQRDDGRDEDLASVVVIDLGCSRPTGVLP